MMKKKQHVFEILSLKLYWQMSLLLYKPFKRKSIRILRLVWLPFKHHFKGTVYPLSETGSTAGMLLWSATAQPGSPKIKQILSALFYLAFL